MEPKFALVSFDVRVLSSKPIRVQLLFYGSKTSKIENYNGDYAADQNEKVRIFLLYWFCSCEQSPSLFFFINHVPCGAHTFKGLWYAAINTNHVDDCSEFLVRDTVSDGTSTM